MCSYFQIINENINVLVLIIDPIVNQSEGIIYAHCEKRVRKS